jgi:hypothetical protein
LWSKKGALGRFSFVKSVLNKFIYSQSRHLALGVMLLWLSGCAPGSLLVEVGKAAWSGTMSGGNGVAAMDAPLNPNYRYLRVQLMDKPPALLVLGYLDPHPLGEIEVWYASGGETLKLQNGRIIGANGLEVNWLRLSYLMAPPDWQTVPPSGAEFSRVRDESPGYRFGIQDKVLVKALAQAPVAQASAQRWFSESYSSSHSESVPMAFFGVNMCQGKSVVVYSRQCLSGQMCLTLQPWPPQKDCP